VAATYHPPQADPVLPTVLISQATFDSTFPTPQDTQAFVKVDGGASTAATASLKRALTAYPDAKVQTRAAWVTAQAKSVDQVLDALGLPLGVLLAALTTRALGSLGIGFHLPGQQLVAFVVLAVVAGIGAAVLPPRRAARLNVLHALQYE
jgi:hypothetical protein